MIVLHSQTDEVVILGKVFGKENRDWLARSPPLDKTFWAGF